MPQDAPVRLQILRLLLALDAAVLLALGTLFILLPARVEPVFGFRDLPGTAGYLIGLWGCALISLGVGYGCAIRDPVRNVNWVRAGIVRGALECAFGCVVVAQHTVTLRQAGFGTILAGGIAAGYLILYPAEAAQK